MSRKKSSAVLAAENRLLKNYKMSEGIAFILVNAMKWGAVAYGAHCATITALAFAGKTTLANIGVKILANGKINEACAWGVAGSGVIYGRKQRKLRRDVVERLGNRVKELEGKIDPSRSSSLLSPRGETRPEDDNDL